MIMNILKRLFCKHNYKYSRSGTIICKEPNYGGGVYYIW